MRQQALFDKINDRIAHDREESDYAYFCALALKLEYLTKIVTSAIIACIGNDTDRHRYSLEHKLVRADSIGTWVQVLEMALIGPPAQLLITGSQKLTRDLTKKVRSDDWRYTAVSKLNEAAHEIGVENQIGRKVKLYQFFQIGVHLRNRSRGHGAPTLNQCSKSCIHLDESLTIIIQNMEIFNLPWVDLYQNYSKKYRVSTLLNDSSTFNYLSKTREARLQNGIYFSLDKGSEAVDPIHVPLIFINHDLFDIFLPNGNHKGGTFETLSYVTNDIERKDASAWLDPPDRLQPSETEGLTELDVQGNVWGNVPSRPRGYIPRRDPEQRLLNQLEDPNKHPIISLTGPGGIGKTSIAITAIKNIAEQHNPSYEVILWVSARDIDLLDSGPKPVSRRVFTQQDISRAVTELLQPRNISSNNPNPDEFFKECLRHGAEGVPTLFVFDNFETLQNPTDVYKWIDSWITMPNKVLITTRSRDFKADFPITIKGMLEDEAIELIDQHAIQLGIQDLLEHSYKEKLINESDGHPYVIKILLGQVAKEGRPVTPQRIVADADTLLNALFKRTYVVLSPAAQRVFLLLCSWRVFVPEVAVEAVLLRPGTDRFNVTDALNELFRYSLVDYSSSNEEDDERFVGVPLAAAMYGRRELEVSPLKVTVEEDRKLLMEFGPGKRGDTRQGVLPRIDNLVKAVALRASTSPSELDKMIPILEYLASKFPKTYLRLTDLVLELNDDQKSKNLAKNYLRYFLQTAEIHEQHKAWMKLADLCLVTEDIMGEIHALCEAAFLPTSDVEDIGQFANRINRRIYEIKSQQVENVQWGTVKELLGQFIEKMEHHLSELSATNCSRLAWLYLNVTNKERALHIANIGIKKEPNNEYCKKIILGLESS